MTVTQNRFVKALRDPDIAVPSGLKIGHRPAGRRFSVYRNNVVVSLTEALNVTFPVIRKLVGNAFFAAMARVYVQQHPPRSQLLMRFGDRMPEFLLSFPPVQGLPYLADVARLELALRTSYHESDTNPIEAAAIADLTGTDILSARLELAASLRMLRSDFPVFSIWLANARSGPKPQFNPENVLVLRREFDPEPTAVTLGQFDFVAALLDGKTLLEASNAAQSVEPDFEIDGILSRLLSHNAIIGIRLSETAESDKNTPDCRNSI